MSYRQHSVNELVDQLLLLGDREVFVKINEPSNILFSVEARHLVCLSLVRLARFSYSAFQFLMLCVSSGSSSSTMSCDDWVSMAWSWIRRYLNSDWLASWSSSLLIVRIRHKDSSSNILAILRVAAPTKLSFGLQLLIFLLTFHLCAKLELDL